MFSYKSKILAISIGTMLTLASCSAQDAGKPAAATGGVVATVNGTPISQARLDFLLKQTRQQGQPDTPELRKNIQDKLIIEEVVAQEAIRNGLDKSADVLTQIDLARQSVLIRAYLQDYVKHNAVSDDALKAEYEKIKSQMGDKEYHARHILVENEADAKAIIAQLKKDPKKFEKLASEKSKDPGSKVKGGDLGWAAPANFVPEFSAAMTKLQKGHFTTEPVKSQFGWHVIKLEDSRTLQAPSFEEIKQNLQQRMQQQQIDKMIADLRAKAKIVETAATEKK